MSSQLDRAELIAELKKPLWVLPAFFVVLLVPGFLFLVPLMTHYNLFAAGVWGSVVAGAVFALVVWINHLRRRIEMLTTLLLDQQDR